MMLLVGVAFATCACERRPLQPTEMPAGEAAGTPAGLVPLNDQPWTVLAGNGWRYLRRTSSKDADIVTDATAPFSPPHVLRIIFTPSMRRDSEPGVNWIGLPESRVVRASWWMKLSPNWTPSPAGGGKIAFFHVWPDGHGVTYSNVGGSRAPHRINVATTWTEYGYRFWDPNVSTSNIAYGRWYRVEWYVKWESTPGGGDGILRWWVDGVLNGDYTNVRFPAGGLGFRQFEFAPTLQNAPPADQYMYIDHTSIEHGVTG
jgi:hypothetical protein